MSSSEEHSQKKEPPTVSVVVPVYNVASYLVRCLESILAQSYPHLEIVLVNDGSRDDSGALCDEYEKKDERIKVLHQENQGASKAREAGLHNSQGEYLVFVDADDALHVDFVKYLLSLSMNYRADLVVCLPLYADRETQDTPQGVEEVVPYAGDEALRAMAKGPSGLMVYLFGKLYRRSLFEGVSFPKVRRYEDEFITYRLIHRAEKVVLTNRKLYKHFEREGSLMDAPVNPTQAEEALWAIRERGDYFQDAGLSNLAQWNARTLFYYFVTFSKALEEDLSPAEWRSWRACGREVRKMLRRDAPSFRFRLLFEGYFWFPRPVMAFYRRLNKDPLL